MSAHGAIAAFFLLSQLPSHPKGPIEVPLDVQVPAFLKALSFDRNLQVPGENIVVGIVFDPLDRTSARAKDQMLGIHKELTRLRVKGKNVDLVPVPYEAGGAISKAGPRVLVVAPLPPSAVENLAASSEASALLKFTTVAADVERGLALGMELYEGRPRFVVNLMAARSSGASFDSSFLALCRIVEQ